MDAKTILAMLLRDALKTIAGALVLHGWVSSGTAEALIGLGMLAGASFWSFWVTSGRTMAQASLDILKAKILNAQELAQRRPAAAAPALASIAAHVEATSPVATPAASAVPPVASALALALAIGLALVLASHPAAAQTRLPSAVPARESAPTPATPRPPICDPLNLLPGCHVEVSGAAGGKTGTQPVELDIWKKIADAALPDLDYASALAAAASTDGGNVRKQCWDALIKANKQASGVGVKNPDGTPMTKPDPHLFVDVESLAEVLDNLTPKGPLWTACAGAAQLAGTSVLTFINAIVTGSAGLAALGVT